MSTVEDVLFQATNKSIDDATKNLINGYLRTISQKLLYVHPNNPYYETPKLVIKLCMVMYYIQDEWDPNCVGIDQEINGNCLIHKGKTNSFCSAFCERIVDRGIHHWKFRIKTVSKRSSGWAFVLGIWKTKSSINPPKNSYFTRLSQGYAFVTDHGCMVNKTGGHYGEKYGKICEEGAVIEMIVNFEKLTLQYVIDGVDYGVACEIEDTSYSMELLFLFLFVYPLHLIHNILVIAWNCCRFN
eukprot:324138_1